MLLSCFAYVLNITEVFLFVNSQQNFDAVRVENAEDIVVEEIATDMETDEVYTPSVFSMNEAEPKVSLVFR
jgi:hypothetical protein